MKYFTPETSKTLEERGLEFNELQHYADEHPFSFSTLDICEIENMKKLCLEEDKKVAEYEHRKFVLAVDWRDSHSVLEEYKNPYELSSDETVEWVSIGHSNRLKEYITLSDEDRVKYIEDYLSNT